MNWGSVVLTTFSSILNSKHLDLFLQIIFFFVWSSLIINSFVFSSNHLHNFSKFDFIPLSVGRPVSKFRFWPLCRRYRFFRKKIDSHCPWYIASLATRSILLDKHLLPVFQLFLVFIPNRELKREVTNFVPTFAAIRVPLIYSTVFSTEKAMCFPIKTFCLWSKNSWFNRVVIFPCFCVFLKGLVL